MIHFRFLNVVPDVQQPKLRWQLSCMSIVFFFFWWRLKKRRRREKFSTCVSRRKLNLGESIRSQLACLLFFFSFIYESTSFCNGKGGRSKWERMRNFELLLFFLWSFFLFLFHVLYYRLEFYGTLRKRLYNENFFNYTLNHWHHNMQWFIRAKRKKTNNRKWTKLIFTLEWYYSQEKISNGGIQTIEILRC